MRKAGLPLHWGMSMVAYPFFATIAELTGRLLRLQESVTLNQLRKRIVEQVGERSTAIRAGQRVVRSIIEWGVLRDAKKPGHYEVGGVRKVDDGPLAQWLLEASLRASGKDSADIAALTRSPCLFPFELEPPHARELTDNARLEVARHGLDLDLVRLKG